MAKLDGHGRQEPRTSPSRCPGGLRSDHSDTGIADQLPGAAADGSDGAGRKGF